MSKPVNLILAGMLLATSALAETLIKESEARLPPAPATATATRSITRGPGIRILSPDAGSLSLASPFPLQIAFEPHGGAKIDLSTVCLLYTSDAADERSSVDLGGRRIIKKKNKIAATVSDMLPAKN